MDLNSFSKQEVYVVWAVTVTYHRQDWSTLLGHFPTEDDAKAVVAAKFAEQQTSLQSYLDKYQVADENALYNLYRELCEAIRYDEEPDFSKADAVYKYFEDHSDISYDINKLFVENPII
jgi:hypothetical protein